MNCELCDRPADNMLAVTARNPTTPRCYWHRHGREALITATCYAPGCANDAGAHTGLCSGHVMARADDREFSYR